MLYGHFAAVAASRMRVPLAVGPNRMGPLVTQLLVTQVAILCLKKAVVLKSQQDMHSLPLRIPPKVYQN